MTGKATTTLDTRAETLRILAAGRDLDDAQRALMLAAIGRRDPSPCAEELLDPAIDAYQLTGSSPEAAIELAGLVSGTSRSTRARLIAAT